MDIVSVNTDYSSFYSMFADTNKKVHKSKYIFILFFFQFHNLPQNRSCKKYIKSSVAGIQDFCQSTV